MNRLCGSGLDAVGHAARAMMLGEADLIIAGGVESMTRAPFVMGKAEAAVRRSAEIYDTTIGWRFVNPTMKAAYGIDAMPETAENVATDHQISRADQDAFAYRSQRRCKAAQDRASTTRRSSRSRSRTARPRPSSTRTSTRAATPRSKRSPSCGRVPRGRLGHRRQRLGHQ